MSRNEVVNQEVETIPGVFGSVTKKRFFVTCLLFWSLLGAGVYLFQAIQNPSRIPPEWIITAVSMPVVGLIWTPLAWRFFRMMYSQSPRNDRNNGH